VHYHTIKQRLDHFNVTISDIKNSLTELYSLKNWLLYCII
jgi:hypothetical protein